MKLPIKIVRQLLSDKEILLLPKQKYFDVVLLTPYYSTNGRRQFNTKDIGYCRGMLMENDEEHRLYPNFKFKLNLETVYLNEENEWVTTESGHFLHKLSQKEIFKDYTKVNYTKEQWLAYFEEEHDTLHNAIIETYNRPFIEGPFISLIPLT